MKIYPQDFKRKAKSAKAAIRKIFTAKVASTKLNDALARAYGWQHYHELNQSIKNKVTANYEQDLEFNDYSRLIDHIHQEIIALIGETKLEEIEDQLKINFDEMDEPPKEITDFINSIEEILSSGKFSQSEFFRSYYATLEEKRHLNVLRTAFDINSDRLRTHTMLFNKNSRTRILNLMKIFKPKYFREGRGLWFVTESEFSVLKPRILKIIKDENFLVANLKDKSFNFDEFFLLSEIDPLDHLFFVYPDDYTSNLDKNTLPPEHFIKLLSSEMSKEFSRNIDGPIDVITPRKNTFTILYVNEVITNIPKGYAIKVAQSRSFGIASVVGSNSYKDAEGRIGEELYSLLANSNIHGFDSNDVEAIEKIERSLDIKSFKQEKFLSKGSSLISLPAPFRYTLNRNYIVLDKDANIEKTI